MSSTYAPSPEVLESSSSLTAEVASSLGLVFGYYRHPLSAELASLIDEGVSFPDMSAVVEATRVSLIESPLDESTIVKERIASVTKSVLLQYPDEYLGDGVTLSVDQERIRHLQPKQRRRYTQAWDEAISNSRTALIETLETIETRVPAVAVSDTDIAEAAEELHHKDRNRMEELLEVVHVNLEPNFGIVRRGLLRLIGREDKIHMVAPGKTVPNVNRALEEMICIIKSYSDPQLAGCRVAEVIKARLQHLAAQVIDDTAYDLVRAAVTSLDNELQALPTDGTLRPAEPQPKRVQDINRGTKGNNKISPRGTPDDRLKDDTLNKSTAARVQILATQPLVSKVDTDQSMDDKEKLRHPYTGVKVAKRMNNQFITQTVHAPNQAEQGQTPSTDSMVNALLETRDIAKWLKAHPHTDDLDDIRAILKLLLTEDIPEGSETIKAGKISVLDSHSDKGKRTPWYRFSPRRTTTVGGGFKSNVTEQLRIYYTVIQDQGNKCFVLIGAGNKSQVSASFERKVSSTR